MVHNLIFNSVLGQFLMVIPIVAVIGSVYAIMRYHTIKPLNHSNYSGELLRLLFVCYLAVLVFSLWVPTNFWTAIWYRLIYGHSGTDIGKLFLFDYNLSSAILEYFGGTFIADSWTDLIHWTNIILFLPMGLFLSCFFKQIRLLNIVPIALLISSVVEIVQPAVGRYFDVDDILFNTIGIVLGFLVAALVSKFKTESA